MYYNLLLFLFTYTTVVKGLERYKTYFGLYEKSEISARNEILLRNTETPISDKLIPTITFSDRRDESKHTEVYSSASFLTISITSSIKIDPTDAIGFFCEDSGELIDFVYLENGFAKEETTVIVTSNNNEATVTSRFHHMRCQLIVKYIVGGVYTVEQSAYPLEVLHRDPSTPYHLRIAYGPQPSSDMWFSWTADSNASRPFVFIGSESNNYTYKFYAVSSIGSGVDGQYWDSYYQKDLCGSPANISSVLYYMWPGYFANVLLSDLKPNTKYYAIYGSDESVMSAETTFTTGKSPDPDTPVRIASFGDMALSVKGAESTVRHVVQLHEEGQSITVPGRRGALGIDAVIHFGDLGYAEGSTVIWDVWHEYVESATRQIPYMVSPGNHEADHANMVCFQDPSGDNGADGTGFHPSWGSWGDDSQGEGGTPIYHRFRTPASPTSSDNSHSIHGNSVFWYSFTIGSIHTIQLSSEQDFTPGSKQYQWLEQDLKNLDRSIVPWVLVTLHRPMMSPEEEAYVEGAFIIRSLEPMFIQYNVNLVMGGHAHVYQRMCAMQNFVCTPASEGGITYLVVGSAGATVHNMTMMPQYEKWVQDWRVEWGFGLVTSANCSALHWEFFSNTQGKVVDDVWIMK
jgi:hypothetical protein